LIAGLAVLAVAARAVPTALYVGRIVPEPVATRFEIQTAPTGNPASFALSPDGRQLAFVATTEGAARLWVRPLDRITAQTLAGTGTREAEVATAEQLAVRAIDLELARRWMVKVGREVDLGRGAMADDEFEAVVEQAVQEFRSGSDSSK
jgi:hypothetical protein